MSTLSRSSKLLTRVRATSGLSSSSATITVVFAPPKEPPSDSTARLNPSCACFPSAPGGPDSVRTRPTLRSAACAIDSDPSDRASAAIVLYIFVRMCSLLCIFCAAKSVLSMIRNAVKALNGSFLARATSQNTLKTMSTGVCTKAQRFQVNFQSELIYAA